MKPDLGKDNSIPLPTLPTQLLAGLGLKYLTQISQMWPQFTWMTRETLKLQQRQVRAAWDLKLVPPLYRESTDSEVIGRLTCQKLVCDRQAIHSKHIRNSSLKLFFN